MSEKLQAIRGMHDILPDQTPVWQFLESSVIAVLQSYGYREIRMPLLEKTELFHRSIGAVTDIVEKEMYTFEDRNGSSLTLRPEGTAGSVRAGIDSGLLYNQVQRLWYNGAMFRHERPQKGRHRQFYQIGVEAFGLAGPDIDAELILMSARIWRQLGIRDVSLQINTLGTSAARTSYRHHLLEYFSDNHRQLDEDSQRRLHSNPLRILDSKNPQMHDLIAAAPQIDEHLDDESQEHFDGLLSLLDNAGIVYEVNPRLVRGLDYYGKTVFEWVTDRLGAQGTLCAGGRYDGLVEQLGGSATPAAGFAMGLERLVAMLEYSPPECLPPVVDCYMIMAGEAALQQGLSLAERLRDSNPRLRLQTNCGGGSFKSQMKRADKSGALLALILGEDEVKNDTVVLKALREEMQQQTWAWDELIEGLSESNLAALPGNTGSAATNTPGINTSVTHLIEAMRSRR